MNDGPRPDPYEHRANYFVGSEFLAWLWWRAVRGEGQVELPNHGHVEFWIDEELMLSTPEPGGATARWTGSVPLRGPQGTSGLGSGKRVARMRVGLRKGAFEASAVIDAQTLDLQGLKVPPTDSRDYVEKLMERIAHMETARSIIDALFIGFLRARTHERWHEEWAPAMLEWIHQVDDE